MKTILFLFSFFIFVSPSLFAQSPEMKQAQIDEMKKRGTLPVNFSIKNRNGAQRLAPHIQPRNEIQSASICDCLILLDSTFSVAQFDYQGGSGGPGQPPLYRNDDWSTNAINLPFNFCYFGQTINSIYINNNGNISFGSTYSTFTAVGFPSNQFTMIAPFWADVDTRGALSGVVYYKVTPTHLVLRWDHVGYYGAHDSLLNTFQLIITDGNDSLVPTGNTSFCYGDMQWSTGDASGGSYGFGGTPATVGANLGDGINYIQFGLFDQSGYAYDGPDSLNDGVDWLDSSNFIFDLCPANVPPIPLDCIYDTVYMRVADTIDIDISFISPESAQITTLSINSGGLNNLATILNTSGEYAHYRGRLVADASNLGFNNFSVMAFDNGLPPQATTVHRVYNIDTQAGVAQVASPIVAFSPNPFSDEAVLSIESKNSKNLTLIISDITGREIMRAENISSSTPIEKEKLGSGVFIYHVFDNQGINSTGKLIVY